MRIYLYGFGIGHKSCGAKIVLVDCSNADGSIEMDYSKLEAAITEKTKAIIPVDIAGVPCDYDRIFGIVEKKRALLEKLKSDYDIIFMDCPPVEMLADASIIAKYADKTLFVVRAGLLEREMLPMIDKYYNEQILPNMAVLLNGTEKFNGHYGYYHHYGDYYQRKI